MVSPLRLMPGSGIEVLDQSLLPGEERIRTITDVAALCEAIATLRIRGAPLLGIAGAAGIAIAAEGSDASDSALRAACATITSVRPTAVELGSLALLAVDCALAAGSEPQARRAALWRFAAGHLARREAEDRAIGVRGAELLPVGCAVLTHCNTGALATGGIGTALGVIRTAWEEGKLTRCYATETRPLLQGARLTMWELADLEIPATLLPDSAAASLIASGRVDAVITGADRIAMNGDSANKVGTYPLAVLAARHGVPFYIAAPTTTVDPAAADGAAIPIEFRDPAEVAGFGEARWAPAGIDAYNPAFDVTPAALITAIITERAVARAPYEHSIAALTRDSTRP